MWPDKLNKMHYNGRNRLVFPTRFYKANGHTLDDISNADGMRLFNDLKDAYSLPGSSRTSDSEQPYGLTGFLGIPLYKSIP